MKKILLSIFTLAVVGITAEVSAQSCNLTTPLIKYTTGSGIAPFTIDGSIADWETNILGTSTGDATTPFSPPAASAANYSLDGTGTTGPDLDSPTPPRDLRFFSFTYDNYNVYFYFRRIINSNSQNTFLYLLDVNADGFMNDGEPVIRANFNSSSISNYSIHRYITNAGVDYVAGKGNYMTKPTAPNAGFADGYSVSGSMNTTGETLPALNPNEVFAAQVTESGFGVEFAVPWRYLKNYLTNSTPLVPGNVFTYHISTQNGTGVYVTSGAEDNAGGCCSGLASVGTVNYTTQSVTVSNISPNLTYRAVIKMKNLNNAPTKVSLDNAEFNGIVQYNSLPINETNFIIKSYNDANNNGILDPAEQGSFKTFNYSIGTYASQPIIYLSPVPKDSISLAANGNAGDEAYFIVDVTLPANYSVKSTSILFGTTGILNLPLGPCDQAGTPQNAPANVGVNTTLPVDFKSFVAVRNRSNVLLKWETSSEKNSSGFAIERNMNGTWEQIAFVNSQAANGNSDALLSYTYNDLNNTKGITQYRIKQVDFDNKSKYTEIRSVRGLDQIGKVTVYPNPTSNGTVNVVFDDASVTRTIFVTDMSGRTLKQINNVTNNNITIDNLQPGMYTLRIMVPETGEQIVQKIVVNKR